MFGLMIPGNGINERIPMYMQVGIGQNPIERARFGLMDTGVNHARVGDTFPDIGLSWFLMFI
jgi:hypothetical protein